MNQDNFNRQGASEESRPSSLKPLLNAVTAHIMRQYNLWKPYPIHDGYYHWSTGYRDIFSWGMPDEMVDNLAGSGVTAEMDEMTIRMLMQLATEDDMATHRRPPALRRAAKHISDRLKAYQPDYMSDELFVQILSRWQDAYDSELRWELRKGVDEALLESTIRLKLSMEAL